MKFSGEKTLVGVAGARSRGPCLEAALPCAQPCVLNMAEEAFPQKQVVPTFISFTSKARASEFLFLHKP